MRPEAEDWVKKADEDCKTAAYLVKGKKWHADENIIAICAEINPHYTSTRYPDTKETHNPRSVRRLVRKSQEVLTWVKHQLK